MQKTECPLQRTRMLLLKNVIAFYRVLQYHPFLMFGRSQRILVGRILLGLLLRLQPSRPTYRGGNSLENEDYAKVNVSAYNFPGAYALRSARGLGPADDVRSAVLVSTTTGSVYLARRNSTRVTNTIQNTTPALRLASQLVALDVAVPTAAVAIDLDLDGLVDVIVASRQSGELLWYRQITSTVRRQRNLLSIPASGVQRTHIHGGTEAPSDAPTEAPTRTIEPTLTLNPTDGPTLHPSASPTDSHIPTSLPSLAPSAAPVPFPSPQPSQLPAPQPTLLPLPKPTSEPSPLPSQRPSHLPSALPSKEPTPLPSIDPTHSLRPSPSPTGLSESPSSTPSLAPSMKPATVPTISPTLHSDPGSVGNDSESIVGVGPPLIFAAIPEVLSGLTGVRLVATADFNKDGWPDLLIVDDECGLCVRVSPGSGSESSSYDPSSNSNDDGNAVALELFGTPVAVWGDAVSEAWWSGAKAHAITVDVDGDGDIDIFFANAGDNSVRWFENDGGMGNLWVSHMVSDDEDGACFLAAADGDEDGDVDLVVMAPFAAQGVVYFESDLGGDRWTRWPLTEDFSLTRPMGVTWVDFDSDGFSDIVVASDDPDAPLALLRQRPWEYDDGSGADILDDEVDLGWVSAGGTRFNKAQVLFATDSGDTATGVVALDWEGDGDVDLAAITPDGGDSGALWVLTNQLDVGPPSTAPSSSPTSLPTPLPTAAPSEQPTELPTSMPSPVPSFTPAPTEVPSLEPSPLPSAAPSALPSSSPSSLPSATPTVSPSSSPSSNPTPLPSELPSRLPSSLPSAVPSAPPTQLPTPAPTLVPTPLSEQPSPSPSSLPSAAPTPLPSAAPTGYVTVVKVTTFFTFAGVPASRWGAMEFAAVRHGVATLLGSLTASSPPVRMDQVSVVSIDGVVIAHDPTLAPTGVFSSLRHLLAVNSMLNGDGIESKSSDGSDLPSMEKGMSISVVPGVQRGHLHGGTQSPSDVPTDAPTQTGLPTLTSRPTDLPIPFPTPSPTASLEPSNSPTPSPTAVPVLVPSPSPSQVPFPMPSKTPSLHPTDEPSPLPSYRPSHLPSALPSKEPTPLPTFDPTHTLSPSPLPSALPSAVPSSSPSLIPSATPTPLPSGAPTPLPSMVPSSAPTWQDVVHVHASIALAFKDNDLSSSTEQERLAIWAVVVSATAKKVLMSSSLTSMYYSVNDAVRVQGALVRLLDLNNSSSQWYGAANTSTWADALDTLTSNNQSSSNNSSLAAEQKRHLQEVDDSVVLVEASFDLLGSLGAVGGSAGTFQLAATSAIETSMDDGSFSVALLDYCECSGAALLSIGDIALVGEYPTLVPSLPPSPSPTLTPSQMPTPAPTLLPSLLPSTPPSSSPTPLPTIPPSNAPTPVPSTSPSPLPTALPTPVPSYEPSSRPTQLPSSSPTKDPTPVPTLVPSSAPTLLPTEAPTELPVLPPTPLPSSLPTPSPTLLPSESPTQLPSFPPTPLPTLPPSFKPTVLPSTSLVPSEAPSASPSEAPSPAPTVAFPWTCDFEAPGDNYGDDGDDYAVSDAGPACGFTVVAGGNEQRDLRSGETSSYAEAWLRRRRFTPSSGTGPGQDHTGLYNGSGYYMYFEASSPNWPLVTSSLVSPRLPSSGGMGEVLNMSFWFHAWSQDGRNQDARLRVDAAIMTTAEKNSTFADYASSSSRSSTGDGGGLRVYNWTQVWSMSGSHGNHWIAASVILPTATELVRFVATSGNHWQSDIAIYDILITQATPEPTPVPTILPDGVVVGVVIEQVIESLGENITDAQGVSDAVTAILAQDLVASSSTYATYDSSARSNGTHNSSTAFNSTFNRSSTNRKLQSNSTYNSSSSSSSDESTTIAGAGLYAGILDYAKQFNISLLLRSAFELVADAWDASLVTWSIETAANPSPFPTTTPSESLSPSMTPSELPSASPTILPSALPSALPLELPSSVPSTTTQPSNTPRPTPLPSIAPTPNRAPSICGGATNASCGSVFYDVHNGGHPQILGDVGGDVLHVLRSLRSPRTLTVVACPVEDGDHNNSTKISFTPTLWLYDRCPIVDTSSNGTTAMGSEYSDAILLTSSNDTSPSARQSANASLRAMFESPSPMPTISSIPTQVPTPTIDQPSSLPTPVNATRVVASHGDDDGVGLAFQPKCAVLTFDVTPAWLHEPIGLNGDPGSDGVRDLWLAVDGNVGGGSNNAGGLSPSGKTFHLAFMCSALVPSPVPTPPPSATPRPSPVPTLVPARSNCVCMSVGMLAGIAEHCPILSRKFHQGCMQNVTRSDLEEYAGYCPTLALDWGPFFAETDSRRDNYGEWQRGRAEVGNNDD